MRNPVVDALTIWDVTRDLFTGNKRLVDSLGAATQVDIDKLPSRSWKPNLDPDMFPMLLEALKSVLRFGSESRPQVAENIERR